MQKSTKAEGAQLSKKTLVNLGEERQAWLKSVVELSGGETSTTEVLKLLVDQAKVEDPESFIHRLGKMKLKAKLADLEQRKAAIAEEEEKLTAQLGEGRILEAAR